MSALEILSLTLAAIVGSAAQTATGFGVALPVAPLAFALLSPADAVLFRLHEPGRLTALATRQAGVPVGLIACALTTTVGLNGPPLVIRLRARHATLTQLRDTLAVIFLAGAIAWL